MKISLWILRVLSVDLLLKERTIKIFPLPAEGNAGFTPPPPNIHPFGGGVRRQVFMAGFVCD